MYNSFDFINSPVFDTLKRLQTDMNTNSVLAELKRTIDSTNVLKDIIPRITSPFSEINEIKNIIPNYVTSLATYQPFITSLSPVLHNINNYYMPVLQQTKQFENLYNEPLRSVLQNSVSIKSVLSELNLPVIQSINESLSVSDMFSGNILNSIDFNEINALYENGDITDEDIAEEVRDIVNTQEFSLVETWDKIKKSKWFLAMRLVLVILAFLSYPVICEVKKDVLEAMGVYQFWEETGIYEWLNEFFGLDDKTVTEKDAKETVNSENIGNISKQKREDLLAKINKIRTFISAAPQDENTGNLLTYLSDLEKDVNGKKYGLVFEEHREEIDEVLETHTPVLTEEKDLFIDNGGQMNFLIEGDNLAALKLLEKTHKNSIQMIYIDPPYNTQNEDFIYDDKLVAVDDLYRHSKWLSFMKTRLLLCSKLLANKGFIFINIDDNEAPHLKVLCDEIFDEDNYEKTDYIQVRYADKTLKSDMSYHKEIEQVLVYRKSCAAKPYIKPQEYDYDKFIYSIKELSAGKEIDLGGKKVVVFKQDEYEIIQHCAGFKDGLKEIWATGTILNGNSSGRFFRDYLDGRKDIDGLGVLYKVYGIGDDQYPYRYFTGPKKANATKGKYYQGVPSEKMTDGATKITPIPNFYDMAGDFGNIRHEGGVSFNSGKKPVKLINMYIDYFAETDITVLDFFAGSGSTGHAVLKRNALDCGTRKFILCTNNESGICRNITYTRIKNVLSENRGSLKYYKIDYVPIDERMYYEYADELLKHIRELVELENGVNFNGNAEIAIVLTEEELGAFVDNIQNFAKCRKLYMGHDLLPTEEQQKAISVQQIEVNIIPDYYYRDLQER